MQSYLALASIILFGTEMNSYSGGPILNGNISDEKTAGPLMNPNVKEFIAKAKKWR